MHPYLWMGLIKIAITGAGANLAARKGNKKNI